MSAPGKIALAHGIFYLNTKTKELRDQAVCPKVYMTLLTTGKKWLVLKRSVFNDQTNLIYSKEVEVMNENWEDLPVANWNMVTEMIQELISSVEALLSLKKKHFDNYQGNKSI